MLDETAERVVWADATRGHEEVQANLSRLSDMLATATRLIAGAQHSMAGDVAVSGRVSRLALLPMIL